MKHAYPDNFARNFEQSMVSIQQVEQSLFALGSVDVGVNSGMGGND